MMLIVSCTFVKSIWASKVTSICSSLWSVVVSDFALIVNFKSISENFECKQCGKQFGNRHILQLHTRLHASQTSLPEGGPTDAVTVTSAKQSNGSLNINFNVSLNINLSDGFDPLDLDNKLNELLANATKASFHEALRREKIEKLTNQLKNELLEAKKSTDTSPSKSSDSSEGELSTKNSVSSPSPPPPSTPSTPTTLSTHTTPTTHNPPSVQEKAANELVSPEILATLPKPLPTPPPKPPVRVNPHNRRKLNTFLSISCSLI